MLTLLYIFSVFQITAGLSMFAVNHNAKSAAVFSYHLSDTSSSRPAEWIVLPIIFKSPDTGIAAGLLPQVVFYNPGSENPSHFRIDTYYTQKRQYHFLFRSSNWLKEDQLKWTAKLSFKDWPASYFGLGNRSNSDSIPFSERIYDIETDLVKRFGFNLYLGIGYRYRYGRISYPSGSTVRIPDNITGAGTFNSSGFSAIVNHDTRDNHFYPSRGSHHSIEVYGSFPFMRSDTRFSIIKADFRKYISLSVSQVLALQMIAVQSSGDIPYRMMPTVGNSLRGYSSVRYIDRNLMAAQIEYRFVPVAWRAGFVLFAGAGDVFRTFSDLAWRELKYSIGAGVRFIFSRNEKVNIRFDYGSGRDSTGDYLDLNEAF